MQPFLFLHVAALLLRFGWPIAFAPLAAFFLFLATTAAALSTPTCSIICMLPEARGSEAGFLWIDDPWPGAGDCNLDGGHGVMIHSYSVSFLDFGTLDFLR